MLEEAKWKSDDCFSNITEKHLKSLKEHLKSPKCDNGFYMGGYDDGYDPARSCILLNNEMEICESEKLEIYKNRQTNEVRVVLNNMHTTQERKIKNKDVIISLSKNELSKYNSLTEAVGDKITKLNKLFGSSAESLTGEDGDDGYDISVQQIFIKDSKIYQPIDNEKLYEIGDFDNLPKTVYLVGDKKQSNDYKPDDFLKGIKMLQSFADNDDKIKQIKKLLSECINKVKNSQIFIEVKNGICEKYVNEKYVLNDKNTYKDGKLTIPYNELFNEEVNNIDINHRLLCDFFNNKNKNNFVDKKQYVLKRKNKNINKPIKLLQNNLVDKKQYAFERKNKNINKPIKLLQNNLVGEKQYVLKRKKENINKLPIIKTHKNNLVGENPYAFGFRDKHSIKYNKKENTIYGLWNISSTHKNKQNKHM